MSEDEKKGRNQKNEKKIKAVGVKTSTDYFADI